MAADDLVMQGDNNSHGDSLGIFYFKHHKI